MYYYEVWVSSSRYHGEGALTYASELHLAVGSIVIVPLQQQKVVALVVKKAAKPRFKTKQIIRTVSSSALAKELQELIVWLKDYYPAPFGQLMSLILPTTLIGESRKKLDLGATRLPPAEDLPVLTSEQERSMSAIDKSRQQSVLLHGDTGTGKTRVYLELVKQALENGRSAILLTPEIGLTPQLALACSVAFPGKTVIVHSGLTASKRRNIWLYTLESPEPLVIIGARSALFSPLGKVGLIVVDEFHETSYKQEQTPYYQTARVAAKLAYLHKAKLILGSATPPIADYFAFKQKDLPIIRMTHRVIQTAPTPPQINIIDLKKREVFRSSPWLADDLIQGIERAISRNEQSLVFLNRRGTARLILCEVCGWQAACPRCDLCLTYHSDRHNMQCHTCGFRQKTPLSCPDCGANNIIFRNIGTKSLYAELQRLFPRAVIKRFDGDNTKPERLEQQYTAVRSGAVDILIGTQVLAKGLDLPKLSVLGVVLADTGLSFPDYTSEERTFQLLTQVVGRVNRGHVAGEVYIQTYHPESPLLKAALNKDYEHFLANQLIERKLYGFPPFRFTLKLTCSRAKRDSAENSSKKLAQELRRFSKTIEIIGPTPAFVEKIQNRYRWHIIVKSFDRPELTRIIKRLPSSWSYDIDPLNLL